jgi:hypothetical protein
MQRINKYLLTHYPLLWNLRIHIVWPVILLLHILFFLTGYTSISFPASLRWSSLHAEGGTISMAVLCALIVGILWLVYYLRNNAFKSFYPLKPGRLAAEALLILITCIGLISFIPTYHGGTYGHLRGLTSSTNLSRETNITNLAHHFIPFSREAFSSTNDCAYRQNEEDAYNPEMVEAAPTAVTTTPAVDTFSYLHYCHNDVAIGDEENIRTDRQNDTIAKRWLLNNQQDSVATVIKEYLALVKKYGGNYRFNADQHTRQIFSEQGFPIRYIINQYDNQDYVETDTGITPTTAPTVYIQEQGLTDGLSIIARARRGWLNSETAIFLLYWSLGIALLIFSFRITQVRVWFIAIIGCGIWCAIFGVLAAFGSGVDSGYALSFIFILLSIAFAIASITLIRSKQSKRNAGVLYLWSLWSTPALIPTIMVWLQHITSPKDIYEPVRKISITPPAPLYDWIQSNWPLIATSNLTLFLLLLIFLYIPLARKWQAMPEE